MNTSSVPTRTIRGNEDEKEQVRGCSQAETIGEDCQLSLRTSPDLSTRRNSRDLFHFESDDEYAECFVSEARRYGRRLSRNHLVEVRHIIGWIVGSVGSQALMLPFHEAIRFGHVELFFIGTVVVVLITAVTVADDQGLQVLGQLTTERFVVRSPNFVDHVPEVFCDERVAVGMDFVGGITDFDAGARIAASGPASNEGQIRFPQGWTVEGLEGARILPVQLGDPQIDVVLVEELNIPGESIGGLRPIELACVNDGIERIRRSRHVVTHAQIGAHRHPREHVIRLRGIGIGCRKVRGRWIRGVNAATG